MVQFNVETNYSDNIGKAGSILCCDGVSLIFEFSELLDYLLLVQVDQYDHVLTAHDLAVD